QQIKKRTEIHNYPKKSVIEYSETGRSYTYNIIKEGQYPPAIYLKYTQRKNGFRIPDDYEVESSWEKSNTKHLVKCIIEYIDKNPIYYIYYGHKYQFYVKSEKSCSDAANLYSKALNPMTKTRYSGPQIFGLQLEILQQIRDNKRQITVLKSFDNLTSTGQNNRAKKIASSIHTVFDQVANKNCHPEDESILKSIEFDINNKSFYFDVNEKSNDDNKYKARAAVKACDKSQITREGYRTLASISFDLPREWKVSLERKDITDEINKAIPISTINLVSSLLDDSINSEIHINDTEIINNMQLVIGKGGRRTFDFEKN
ncbi:961_t:CDS:2, partial [Dentiscutata heterogama]